MIKGFSVYPFSVLNIMQISLKQEVLMWAKATAGTKKVMGESSYKKHGAVSYAAYR